MSLKVMQRIFSFVLVAGMLLGFVAPAGAQPGQEAAQAPLLSAEKVEGLVLDEIAANGQTDFFVWMSVKPDLSEADTLRTKAEKGQYVFDTVRATAEQTQKDLRGYLDSQGVTYRPYYIVNAIFVQGGNLDLAMQVASRTDVSAITANHTYQLEEPFIDQPVGPTPDTIESNLLFINADDAWAMGATGQGTLMAGNDTGLDETHPTIAPHYRGCVDPPACTTWDHNFNWWDATGTYPMDPYDGHGHGTHTTGTMVGDDFLGNQIGVAPGAQTVHCKNMTDGGSGSDSTFLDCFEWDLAPWDLTGANADPTMAPDAVNNSWGYGGGGIDTFRTAILALQAAGIAVEVSAGNEGPSCQTLRSPGDYQEVLTTGSVDHIGQTFPGIITVGSWSTSRGPSSLDGNYFPDVMAPGNGIRSSLPGNSYGSWGGTSMAGPHATALVGLIWSACPAMTGMVDQTYELIKDTAGPLTGQSGSNCGGDYTVGPNNDWGFGTINAEAAVGMAIAMCSGVGTLEGTVSDAIAGTPIEGAKVVADWDGGGTWTQYTDENGFYNVTVPEGDYVVTGSHPMFTDAFVLATVITDTTTVADIELTPRGRLFGYVTDFDSGMALEGATVTADDGTMATTDANGFYEMYLDEGTFDVEAELENYAPGTATVVMVAGADTQQDFALMGAISFTPAPVEITLDMGDAGVMLDATLLNRQPWDYDFEFMEISNGFVPTVLQAGWNEYFEVSGAPSADEVAANFTGSSPAGLDTRPFIHHGSALQATNIIVYSDDNYSHSPTAVQYALDTLGLTYTFYGYDGAAANLGAFIAAVNMGGWDLVILEEDYWTYNDASEYTAVANHILAGGMAIVDSWAVGYDATHSGNALWGLMGVSYAASIVSPPSPLFWWEDGHPLFNSPESVPEFTSLNNPGWLAYGARMNNLGDPATGLGGFTTDPAAGQDGIVLSENGLTIYKGLVDLINEADLDGDTVRDVSEWWINAINGLLVGFASDVPWFSEEPITGTVPASSTVPGELDVTMYFTATADVGVTQPGDYLATLKVTGDPSMDVPVVMTVNPPTTWGKLFGNVSSLGYCDANPYVLEDAIVWLTTASNVYSATTDVNGNFQWWLDELESPVDVSVDFPEHVGAIVEDVVVIGGEEVEVNFMLRWNHPCVDMPTESMSSTLEWGDSSTQVITITNNGAAALDFELVEKDRGWQPALAGQPIVPAERLILDTFAANAVNSKGSVETTGTRPMNLLGAGDVLAQWPTGLVLPWGTNYDQDDDTVWLSDPGVAGGDDNDHEFATDGTPTGRTVSASLGGDWAGDMAWNSNTGKMWQVNVGGDNCLYELDTNSGATGNTVCGPWSTSQRGVAYDPDTDSFYVGGWNEGIVYHIDATGALIEQWTVGLSISGLAFNHQAGFLFIIENSDFDTVSVMDVANGTIVNSFTIPGFGNFVGAGLEIDCDGNLWAANQGDANAYLVDSGVPASLCVTDVPWLSESPITGTVPADGGFQVVDVTMDSKAVDQPGEYYATLAVKSNDPENKSISFPVTMTVIPADNMGKLTGMVWDNCLETPVEEVMVHVVDGDPITMTYTDDMGEFTAWLVEGTYTVTFSLADYVTFEAEVTIVAGQDTILDVALVPDRPCLATEPEIIEVWVLTNTAEYVFGGGLDIINNGAQDLDFSVFEVPPMVTANGIDSLSGSFVVFDPTLGGDEFYIPGTEQTFCFHTESFTNDWEYVYELFARFPTGWEVNNVTVVGTPSCTGGGYFDPMSWDYWDDTNEIDIYHPRWQSTTDHCMADYCIDVTSAPGINAPVSWYWTGDGYGGVPHHPCSDDGYTPSGYAACDEMINPVAEVPVGNIDFPWIWTEPVTGVVPGLSAFEVGVLFSSISDTVILPIGDYEMTLLVNSNDPVEATSFIPVTMHVVEAYETPVAGFTAPITSCVDVDVSFVNTTTVGIPPTTWYEWDFGDGITSTEENPVHAFADAGVYNVTLEACNEAGCTEFSQAIEVFPEPEASFTFAADLLEVTFTNTSMYGVTFLWDFDDGTTSTEENPVHVFAAEGTYMVTLWVYNDCGVAMFEAEVSVVEGFFYWLPVQYKAIPDEP